MKTFDDRHWQPNSPPGDYPVECDYCWERWRRSMLKRTKDGLLACPTCDEAGVDVAGLLEENENSHPVPREPREWP